MDNSVLSPLYIYWFLIAPGLSVLIATFQILGYRGTMNKAGNLIEKVEFNKNSSNLFDYIFIPVCIVFGIFLLIVNMLVGYLVLIIGVERLISKIQQNLYFKSNGFYENGILFSSSFYRFNDVLSWYPLEDNKVTLYLKNGDQFDYSLNNEITNLLEILKNNGATERNSP